jgi:hypothetical protein
MLDITCPAVEREPAAEICSDSIDNDCDGDTDEFGCRSPSGGCSAGKGGANPLGLLVPALLLILASAVFRVRRRNR